MIGIYADITLHSMYLVCSSCILLYNPIGWHTPGIITVMESDNDSAARRIVTCDRIPGFSHIHNTKMFEITVNTANDENTTMYHTGIL